MFPKKMLVAAAVAAGTLMSPAAGLASGGASGSGSNSKSKSGSTVPTPAPPPECATIANVNVSQIPRTDAQTGAVIPGWYEVMVHADAVNCGTQHESLQWDVDYTNLNTGIQEYTGVYSNPIDLAPGGAFDMPTGDSVTNTVTGKSLRFDFSVKSATTGQVIAQQSVYYTVQ